MALSIVIPIIPNSPRHRDGCGALEEPATFPDYNSNTSSEDGELLSDWQSAHSHYTNSPTTSPVSASSQERVPEPTGKSCTPSLPIFRRNPPAAPPVVHWWTSHDTATSSSSTLVGSPQRERESGDDDITDLRASVDENKLANRSLTVNNAVSHCAALKGFQDYPSLPLDNSFGPLLALATLLDYAPGESNYEGLSEIVQGLCRGVDEFLESLESLPFDLRNTPNFISATSDILQAKSSLSRAAGHLVAQTDAITLHQAVERCLSERDKLLRALRVFLNITDFESKRQAKLSIKSNGSPRHSPKRRLRFRLPRRQSTVAQRSKPPEPPPASSSGQPESKDNAANEDEDEYSFHIAMVSDIISTEESDQYWGVSMPGPFQDAADVVLSEESGSILGASLKAQVHIITDPQPHAIPAGVENFDDMFLLCFSSFCHPVDLAKTLIARCEELEQPVGLNDSQREAWPLYRSLVKYRVLHLINTWVDQYWIPERDTVAGLHIRDFVSLTDGLFELEERDEIIRKLDEQREVAISLAPFGDSAYQSDQTIKASDRIACRQRPVRYRARLQARVEKLVKMVPQWTPTDDDHRSTKALNDLICSTEGGIHILDLNSRELCQELARQLALFMSEGYLKVIPEDLWYRLGLSHDCDGDVPRSTQQTYENALSWWVTGSILDQVEADTRAAVMTFFIALGLRSHEYHNYSAMRSIYDGLKHPCLESFSEMRMPLSEFARLALERLGKLKENVDSIAISGRGVSMFPRPAVPAMEWYFSALGTVINEKTHLMSPNSLTPIANLDRCFNVTRIIREMEHWHVPYNYPRADHAQAWLQKYLEEAIARGADQQSNWMFKRSEAIEQTGRPEPTKLNSRLSRLSNPFGKKNPKIERKEATIFELIPELEPEVGLAY